METRRNWHDRVGETLVVFIGLPLDPLLRRRRACALPLAPAYAFPRPQLALPLLCPAREARSVEHEAREAGSTADRPVSRTGTVAEGTRLVPQWAAWVESIEALVCDGTGGRAEPSISQPVGLLFLRFINRLMLFYYKKNIIS